MNTAQATLVSLRDWQGAVSATAVLNGWRVQTAFDSRDSIPGWPNIVLCRAPEFIVVELKTERGNVTKAQQAWLDDLKASGVDAQVWRPSDWDSKWRPSDWDSKVVPRLSAPRQAVVADG